MLALQGEFANDQGLFRRVINTRTFTLADGIVKSSTFPAPRMFLIPVTVLAVLAASLAPVLRGNEESGLEKAPKDFSIFRAESEMTNGAAPWSAWSLPHRGEVHRRRRALRARVQKTRYAVDTEEGETYLRTPKKKKNSLIGRSH